MEPRGFELINISMLVFHLDMLNHAGVASARVIYAHFLTGPERGSYDFARAVNDACRRPESKADRTLTLTSNHDGFAGRVCLHGADFIRSRIGRCRRDRRWRCAFRCSRACLGERHWRDRRTSDCEDTLVHNPFPDCASPLLLWRSRSWDDRTFSV